MDSPRRSRKTILMVQALDMAGELVFDRISTSLSDKDDRRLAVQRFTRNSGISGSELRWDYLYDTGWEQYDIAVWT